MSTAKAYFLMLAFLLGFALVMPPVFWLFLKYLCLFAPVDRCQ